MKDWMEVSESMTQDIGLGIQGSGFMVQGMEHTTEENG